jgi:hypothetical protein
MSSISVLTWNICFGCMYSNKLSKNDITAYTLATTCEKKSNENNLKENICLNNVVQFIKESSYDFICLQEATNWDLIYGQLTTLYPTMSYIHNKVPISFNSSSYSDLVTFYDSSKFKIEYIKADNLTPGSIAVRGDGRPYHILFFKEIATNEKFIVINLHCQHHWTIDKLERVLSNDLANCVDLTSSTLYSFRDVDTMPNTDTTAYILSNASKFNVIIMGDFNDQNRGNLLIGNFWKGMSPFKYIDPSLDDHLSSLKNIILKTMIEPPITCCAGTSNLRPREKDIHFGDYILIDYSKLNFTTGGTNPNKIPDVGNLIYDAFITPTSDHIPVEAKITVNSTSLGILPVPVPVLPVPVPVLPVPVPVLPVPVPVLPVPVPVLSVPAPVLPVPVPVLPVPAPTKYKLTAYSSRTLRLQDSPNDPNAPGNESLNGNPFKGAIINNTNKLIYPNGKVTPNMLVLVADKDNSNIIGYVKNIYLTKSPLGDYYTLNLPSRTLRLQDNSSDPNIFGNASLNGKPFKGQTILNTNKLIYPNGQVTRNGYVLVQNEDDNNTFGYVHNSYITAQIGGRYYEKYLKYKNKYLSLKNIN